LAGGSQWLAYALVLASTALMLAVGWVAVYQQVSHERSEAAEAATTQAQNRAVAFEQYVARTLEGADLATRHIAYKYLRPESGGNGLDPRRPLLIRDPVAAGSTFRVVTVVSPTGDLLATSERRGAQPSNVSRNRAFVEQVANPGTELMISPPIFSRRLNDTFIYLTRRVLQPDGSTIGFVGVQIRPSALSNFLRSASFGPHDLISVIGLDGITRARREGNELSFGQDVRGKLVMRMQARDPNGSYLGPSSIDGEMRYFSHRRIAGYPVFVTAGISEAATMQAVDRSASIYYTTMGLVTFVSTLFAAFIILGIRQRQIRVAALAEANRRLREAQRIARIGDWEWDLRTGAMHWSDQLCTMYERDPASDRLTLGEFDAYLDEESRAVFSNTMNLALATGQPQSCEFSVSLPSGATSDRFVIAIPTRSEQGDVISFVGTDQDVTSERLVRSLREQVAHLSRVDAMNTMAATLAHELNQPLTAACSYLSGGERLLGRSDDAARSMTAEAFAAARGQVQMAGNIIRRVREMLGSERRPVEAVPIGGLIDDTIALLSATGSCSRKWVTREVQDGAALIWGDRVQIQQVLVNLVRNACEAASEHERPWVRVSASLGGDGGVIVSVSDNGRGIDRPAEQLFSPFSSTKDQGLGLGLSISRTIVEYHGGRIWLERSDRTGTTMSFSVKGAAEAGEFGLHSLRAA
jgi:signal transduction histidine kinase